MKTPIGVGTQKYFGRISNPSNIVLGFALREHINASSKY